MTRDEEGRSAPVDPATQPNPASAAQDSVLAAKARAKAKRDATKKLKKAAKAAPTKTGKAAKAREPRGAPKSGSVAEVGTARTPATDVADAPILDAADLPDVELPAHAATLLLRGAHRSPHAILGAHPAQQDGVAGVVVRAMLPSSVTVGVVLPESRGDAVTMDNHQN
ncbi:MAG: hypothetical protein ABI120_21915 [Gemmatimonadaceae bacterium]